MGWTMALLPFTLLLLGCPVFLVLLASSIVALIVHTNVPITLVHQAMFGSVDKFTLMAVPFFIFAGELMGRGGMSRRIVAWVLAAIGRIPGSMALTTVGACTVFGAMSGSPPATVVAVGRLVYPTLRAKGYDERFAAGLITSTGAIALIIPPSTTMILYGVSAEQSIVSLFAAGVAPGLLIAVLLALYVFVHARRHSIQEVTAFDWTTFLRASREAVWALGAPALILGGIYSGVFTPTEAAAAAGVYAIAVTRFAYREMSWREIWDVVVSSVFLSSQILLIVAAAGLYSWLLTISGIPQGMVGFIQGLDISPWMVLAVINIFLLIVGCIIDPASAVLVLTPLLVPVVKVLGIDLVHFGIIVTVNLSIGMFTPPFGLNIFAAQAMLGVPLTRIYRGVVPFILINLVGLAIVTYVPGLSLYLTHYLR